jgi:DNA modification methylase
METNTIYCGDNIEVMKHYIPDNSIDLIYADPPFFSNKQYEVLWGDGYELRSFEDRWKGGINNYIAWMEPRLRECHRVLKEKGTMYLHCDSHANAHLRILMDKIFDEKNFRNEIIWYYRGGGVPKKGFGSRHDTIFFYSKGSDYIFNVDDVRQEYSKDSKERLKYVARAFRGKRVYDKYRPNPKGKHPDDVWQIQPTMPSSKERFGYPTQKPERLLEPIIKASSNLMDIVLDPFCGCGTTIAVAHKLGRRWIGIDVSPTACKLMAKRMRSIGAKEIKIIGLPKTLEELKALAPFEFQNWVFEKLHGRVNPKKVGDMGIDGWIELDIPTQVKQSENVGRIVVDKFETAIRRYGKKQGVIIAFSFTKDAYEEVARVKLLDNMNKLDIKLKTAEEILKET